LNSVQLLRVEDSHDGGKFVNSPVYVLAVSELKANQAAQANSAVIFNGRCVDHVLDSLQTARMISCVAPYQFRPDMLLEAGLMLLEPDQPLAISQ
jgi:hypothetical protein